MANMSIQNADLSDLIDQKGRSRNIRKQKGGEHGGAQDHFRMSRSWPICEKYVKIPSGKQTKSIKKLLNMVIEIVGLPI